MVLVGEAHRGRGIGTQMMIHALEWCDQRKIEAVRLDATKLGKPLYEKLGFEVQYELTRFEGIAHSAKNDAGKSIELADGPAELLRLDNAMPGTDRFVLLEALWREAPESIHVVRDEGFAMLRPGFRATQVGPVIASNASAGLALLNHALKQCEGRRIYVDIPVDNRPAVQWAQARGLEAQRPLIRMLRGEAAPDNTARIFASSGPEKG